MKNPSALFRPLTTDRFLIRVLTEDDVTDAYLAWFDDQAVLPYIKAASSRQSLDSLRAFVRQKELSPTALLLGLFTRDSALHVGNLKFEPIDRASGSAIMGVLIGSAPWRHAGAFRETFQAAAASLRDLVGIHTFWLGVANSNPAAIAAYKKTGFVAHEPPRHLYPVLTPGVIYMAYRIGG